MTTVRIKVIAITRKASKNSFWGEPIALNFGEAASLDILSWKMNRKNRKMKTRGTSINIFPDGHFSAPMLRYTTRLYSNIVVTAEIPIFSRTMDVAERDLLLNLSSMALSTLVIKVKN